MKTKGAFVHAAKSQLHATVQEGRSWSFSMQLSLSPPHPTPPRTQRFNLAPGCIYSRALMDLQCWRPLSGGSDCRDTNQRQRDWIRPPHNTTTARDPFGKHDVTTLGPASSLVGFMGPSRWTGLQQPTSTCAAAGVCDGAATEIMTKFSESPGKGEAATAEEINHWELV